MILGPNTIQEKCFLKCFAEQTEMVFYWTREVWIIIHALFQLVNGKIMEEKLISQFSMISAGDVDKLTDMYSTLNFCSNQTSNKISIKLKLCIL